MTQTALIKLEASGIRISKQPHSLHEKEDILKSENCFHEWRTIVCDGENDVVECSECGKHQVKSCNFDDDFD